MGMLSNAVTAVLFQVMPNFCNKNILCILSDYHNNNMMFRKDLDTGKNIDHVMIDLQVTRYGSLCLDLQCYLCFSLDPSVRRQRLHELLQAYLDTLKITSQNLGNPTEITFDV